jgi:hypothetical protein
MNEHPENMEVIEKYTSLLETFNNIGWYNIYQRENKSHKSSKNNYKKCFVPNRCRSSRGNVGGYYGYK